MRQSQNDLTEAYKRRLEAFYGPTEDFYDKAQFRSPAGTPTGGEWASRAGKGGGATHTADSTPGKMWSGVSAHPDRRTPPKATVKFSNMSDKEITELAHKIYDTDLGGGYSSRVVESEPNGYVNGVYVRGYIYKGGKEVGSFERTIGQDESLTPAAQPVFERSLIPAAPKPIAPIFVSHDELMIDPSHRSKGLADRFNAHAVAEYQRLGVDRIIMHAGDEVGGFAWARQGFRFDEGGDFKGGERRKQFLNTVLDKVSTNIKYIPAVRGHQVELNNQVDALRKAIAAGEDVQPIHVASIGENQKWQQNDDHSNPISSWPGKSALLGTSWNAVYFFDASKPITSAASDLEHADLRQAFRTHVLELSFNPKQPRDKNGMWTVGFQHVATKANADAILKGGFRTDTPNWDRSFGDGIYLGEAGDQKSAKFYARQGGREWRDSQVVDGTVSLKNPLHITAREHSNFRSEVVKALGGVDTVRALAQAKYAHAVAITKRIVSEEVGADHGVDLTHPEDVYWVHYKNTPGTPPSVSQKVEDASSRIHDRVLAETGASVEENGSWRWLANQTEKIAKPGIATSSDNDVHYSRLIGNLARDAGYDGIVINTDRWGGVGGTQIVAFDPKSITPTGVRPYVKPKKKSVIASAIEHFAAGTLDSGGRLHAPAGTTQGGEFTKKGGNSTASDEMMRWGIHEGDPKRLKHEGAQRVADAMTGVEKHNVQDTLNYELQTGETIGSLIEYAADVGMPTGMTAGVAAQLASVSNWTELGKNGNRIQEVYSALDEHEKRLTDGTDLAESIGQLSTKLTEITGVTQVAAFVSFINGSWAHSATSMESTMMQMVAATAKQLPDALDALKRSEHGAESLRYVAPGVEKLRKALHAVHEATYRVSQETLADHGMTEITVYRGVTPSRIGMGTPESIIAQPNPLSSWSTSIPVAERFAGGTNVFKATIPASQVYSVAAKTGAGSWEEREIIVLGNPISAQKLTLAEQATGNEFDLKDETEVVYIDENDADWIKLPPVEKSAIVSAAVRYFEETDAARNHNTVRGAWLRRSGRK